MERAREKVDRLEGESQFAYIAFVPKSFKKIMNMFTCKRPVNKRENLKKYEKKNSWTNKAQNTDQKKESDSGQQGQKTSR